MQTDSNLQILDSAVDWLTVTAKRGGDADALIAVGNELLHQSVSNGNYLSTFKSKGYHGKKAGGVICGRRYDGSILTLTSSEAALNSRALLGGPYHVTRLDLQITCADSSCNASRGEIAYHLMSEARKRAGRPASASLRLNSCGGQTLYVGSTKSDIIGRLYDKGIEKKIAEAGACWRYEVQYRRRYAELQAARLSQSKVVDDTIATLVIDYFSHRGVVVPDAQRGVAIHPDKDAALRFSKRETDQDRQLRWLSTFVASTVRRLIESGRRSEVLRALGLDADADS